MGNSNKFNFTYISAVELEHKNVIKIAEWCRKVNYTLEQKEVILESILYLNKASDNIFILQVKKTICFKNLTLDSNNIISNNSCFVTNIEFKYLNLLTCNLLSCSSIDNLIPIILLDHDQKYYLNVYTRYVCYLIDDYYLRSYLKNNRCCDFSITECLKQYLPNELLYIVQTYNLADNFILKDDSPRPIDKNLSDWINDWSLITGTENVGSSSVSKNFEVEKRYLSDDTVITIEKLKS